ncbi:MULTISPECIES: hypothetical protein [unclassified Bradyrhizobium]|uniref:hypothetical protein n=1 Tax=unclassified Bradyrhizobium TaxID=2631580 RepID=UPI00211E1530|nr:MULTISPECIES: hypothetical protein [unclassified Bradyrhizobium]MDD1532732.1 hypothetical protein [Bradyrhizobium sp. WBOS8]MDD1581644.1 hypothetical protein [Bradyrhizobium sp. WBOS4]UUO49913.1 hypothetical protein DCM78_25195 [Bradyrhizobium sp. WBOS04]UUO58680.1 hypothetical protein DCM80_05475 [Bradyrhizobium sp. WBOS08]
MLSFLTRIDRYMTSNMHEHGQYLLGLKSLDQPACKSDHPQGAVRAIEPVPGTGTSLPRK